MEARQSPVLLMNDRGGDVVVIGAGLIGLAIAFELAERGATVRVYDRGEPGRAASWAGAGMLAPYTERVRDEALLEFCASSLREYPAFVERVRAASGIDPHLRLNGVVHAAFNDADLERLQRHAQALAARSVATEMLDRSSLLSAEPWLGSHVAGGLIVSGEGCVDNRRLGRALVSACQTRGVLIERSSALRVECDERRVLGLRTDLGFVTAGAIVNACGAWAAQLQGVPPSCVPPIEPIKGEMLALAAPADFVRHATWVPGAYLVPREDGRLLVGATVESGGFRRARDGPRDARAIARRAFGGAVAAFVCGDGELGRPSARHARRASFPRSDADCGPLSCMRALSERHSARAGNGAR